MKKIYSHLIVFALIFVTVGVRAQCSAGFNFTYGSNGMVSFTSTSVGTNSVTQYTWMFGNGSTYTAMGNAGATAIHQFSANANFAVSLYIFTPSPSACSDSITQTLAISNFTPPGGCSLNAGFSNFLPGGAGNMNFTNNSSGTLASTTYTWNYGDGSPNTFGTNGARTYTANGNYTVTLYANNNVTPSCVDTQTMPVTITNACGIQASFTSSVGPNGGVTFISTSTGTTVNSWFEWSFGDGSSSVGSSAFHTYFNGTYFVTHTVKSSQIAPNCIDTVGQQIVINTNTCTTQPAFSYSVGAGGVVTFSNLSTGGNANTTYNWNFGNGSISNSINPIVTYSNAGTYVVSLQMTNSGSCFNTTTQTISVNTATCLANPNFSMAYGGTVGVWNAIPAYPWNVVSASWSWGDGSVSNTLYGTHNYSLTGNYVICLSVTVSCGDTATSCNTYSVYRSAAPGMIQVTVITPVLKNVDEDNVSGISALDKPNFVATLLPNPSEGVFYVNTEAIESNLLQFEITNNMGRQILQRCVDLEQSNAVIDLSDQASGIYFVRLQSGSQVQHRRIVLQH